MEREHEPGCDGQHAPSERCNAISPAGAVPPDAPLAPAPVRCLRCGGANAASAQDCKHCGARLAEAAAEPQPQAPASFECLTCGGSNAAVAQYCKHCGAAMAEPQPAAATHVASYHCLKCGLPNPASYRYCKQCGAALAETRAGRVSGVAFMLNEAQSPGVRAVLPDAERERLVAHYEDELRALVAPARPAAAPKPAAAQVQLPVRMAATAAAPPPKPARPAAAAIAEPRFRAPKPPSPPRDWSWLAEQQANLFLFAGAFLVVIAALIYVAYSGENVSGVTKMAMFTAFTLAFLAAGAACLRIPRVVAAGHVFFGVGAILVPLSFVAAYTILSDEDLDPQAMWLAGSLTTAILYTSVATLGLGRHYAFTSGVALISAAAAAAAVADLPIEWAPVPFLALAVAMSGVALGGPEIVRRRVGQIWAAQAHAVAGASIIAAIMMALIAAPDEAALDLANRWFLPAAFAVTAAYAALYAFGKRESLAGAALAAASGGAFVTVVYATSLPAEQYTIAFAAVALLFGIALPVVEKEGTARRLPADFATSIHVSAIAATLAAALAGYVMASTRPGADVPDYLRPETHWFAAPALALLLAFYLLDAFGRRQRIAVTGSALALAGLGASLVYGFDASPEYYALALTGAGAAMVIFLRWIAGRMPERMTAPEMAGDTSILAQVALVGGVAVAIYAALAASDKAVDYTPQTAWFLFAAFASAFAAYAGYVTLPMPRYRWQDRAAVVALVLALAGAATSVVYGLDESAEYYALGFAGAGILIVAGLHASLPRVKNAVLHAHVEPIVRVMAQASLAAGVAVAAAAAIYGTDPDLAYTPETRWFLFAAFGWALGGYLLYAMLRSAAAQWHDHLAHLGLGLALTGTCTSVVYGLDASAEYYAFAFVAGAAALLLIAWLALPRVQPEAAGALRDDYVVIWHLAAFVAGFVAVGAVFAAEAEDAAYAPDTRWFLPLLFASLASFYGLAVASRVRPSWGSEPIAPLGFVAAVFGVTAGVVWALDVSAEYYAFAFLVPAAALGLAGRRTPEIAERLLPVRWQEAALGFGRGATGVGVAVAVVAAIAASDPESTYRPDSHLFLPLAFLAATAFLALDASRKSLWWTTAALLAALGGAGASTVYALDAGVEYYGVAFACVGIAFGFAGRTWSPRWLDARSRDIVATVAITTAWLPFERIYGDHEQIGAGVHLAAAAFYALAAVVSRSERTLGQVMNLRTEVPVRVATGWLYAAGWVTTVGYVLLLRGLPAGEGAGAGSLAMPLMGLCLGFLAAGASMRFWRAEFGIHLYIMGLLLSIASLTAAPDAAMLAVLVTVFAGAFLAVAAWEDAPLLAVPSAVFGFIAVAAWQQRLDAPEYVIPLAYSTIATAAYASGFAIRRVMPRWSAAARACGATYALVAPAAGFGILSAGTEGQLFEGAPFEESALYQWSTLGVAIAGIVATIESSLARRGWAVVVGSAVVTASVLLEIGHFRPENIQAYTAVIGAYLVLLGLLGLWKFRLIPEMEDAAPAVEAMGAAVVMLPSFVQSLEGGWYYQMILLAEAAVFFAVSVALRRRLLLGAALMAMVLVAGRALFDAINALPNWVVILIAGLALLGIGTAILVGRDRWASWERSLLSWWDQTGRPQHV